MHNLWFMERWQSPTCFASGAPGWRWSSEIAGGECVVESLSWLVSKRRAIIPICLRKVITLTSWSVFKQRVDMLHSSPDKMWTITSLRIQSNREPSSTANEGLRMETFGWFFSKGIPLRGLISTFPSKYVFLNVHPWQKPFQTLLVISFTAQPKGNDFRPWFLGLQCYLWGPTAVLGGMYSVFSLRNL